MLSALARITSIARLTFFEFVRSRLLGSALLAAAGSVGLGLMFSSASVFAHARIIVDAGLAAASIMGQLVAISAAIVTLAGEGLRQSEFLLLTRPVRRMELLLGRYVGLALLLLLYTLIVVAGAALGCVLAGQDVPAGFVPAAGQTVVELWLSLAVAVALATAASAPLAATFYGGICLAGQLADELRLAADSRHLPAAARALAKLSFALLPDYARISLRDFAAAGLPVPAAVWGQAATYGVATAAAWLCLACLLGARGRRRI